ncbi:hypothetical protein KW843_17090 [Acidovorax sp. sif1233]|uniref:hypothetical protein n=1 Tax=Acidovorax sp. sif1233 TaxID=2854792 RepID=UPI001C4770ED|nr:hypothetical protein [Acidovorax sp. sif1233]MBV7456199.1 hypothetical protein [Acidovorax sp. sif1233]
MKIEIFSGIVIISDILFSSFVFLCGAVFFIFEDSVSHYFFLVGIVGLLVGFLYFYALAIVAKKMSIIEGFLKNTVSKRLCLFCWVLKVAGRWA